MSEIEYVPPDRAEPREERSHRKDGDDYADVLEEERVQVELADQLVAHGREGEEEDEGWRWPWQR